jgi:hypothetical protein
MSSNTLVTVNGCLFAGEVESTGGFALTGDQVNFTSTEIWFDTASLLAVCGGITGLRHVVDMNYSRFVDTEIAEATDWALGGFNESGLVEGSADVASIEFPSRLSATDQIQEATGLRRPTFVVVESSPEGASAFGARTARADPSMVEGSLFGESESIEAPTSNAGLSALDDDWGLGEPTGFEALSFDFIISPLGEGTDLLAGSGVSGLTSGVEASGPEGWTLTVGPSAAAPTLERKATDVEVTSVRGTEDLAGSELAVTQILVDDTGELVQSQIIRVTSKLVTPETGTPTFVWVVLDSTPWPSPIATATPDGQPDATAEEETTVELESVRQSPAAGSSSANASPAAGSSSPDASPAAESSSPNASPDAGSSSPNASPAAGS